MDEYGFETIKL